VSPQAVSRIVRRREYFISVSSRLMDCLFLYYLYEPISNLLEHDYGVIIYQHAILYVKGQGLQVSLVRF
jgi:hypothetical protein